MDIVDGLVEEIGKLEDENETLKSNIEVLENKIEKYEQKH